MALMLITKTDFRLPRDGGALRTSEVVRVLSSAGHSVSAFVAKPSSHQGTSSRVAGFALIMANLKVLRRVLGCASLTVAKWYSPSMIKSIVAARPTQKWNGTIIEYSQLAIYRDIVPGPVLIDMHNIESELMRNYQKSASGWLRRMAALWESRRLARLESSMVNFASAITFVSQRDLDVFRILAKSKLDRNEVQLAVAPNGVAEEGFRWTGTRQPNVVFVAHLGWQPNIDAATWLVEKVWAQVVAAVPHARLQLVGRSPHPSVLRLTSDTVQVFADVESVIPFTGSAAVATAPLLASGGTRLKIMEAMSCGTPVVSTSLGALGLESKAGHGLVIADDPGDFAKALVDMLTSSPSEDTVRSAVLDMKWDSTLTSLVDTANEKLGV
ncbi:glycosyltransferase involved in cell wall biosynthesis [Pseudarthrobacter defluvii]|uniref:Glycosyltransferase involved in cell wall biosynthesis n=1 Tax=Pseudarthrobacter defluvii TaxID=410837 RepID=A0ABT9UEJ7_9MICC|nr:glycosyltransferase [Pseudarthrobacter defluvii]MDQ0118078.1 glycosyltransferase involved in cell wall biosynthesis [Pseudarthrobacter defluvii]